MVATEAAAAAVGENENEFSMKFGKFDQIKKRYFEVEIKFGRVIFLFRSSNNNNSDDDNDDDDATDDEEQHITLCHATHQEQEQITFISKQYSVAILHAVVSSNYAPLCLQT